MQQLFSVDCIWGTWAPWETCSRRCGGGMQTASRTIVRQAENGGNPCLGESMREQLCNKQVCVSTEGESKSYHRTRDGHRSSHLVISLGYGNGYDGSSRSYRPGGVAGGNTAPPRFIEEFCTVPEEPTCNPDCKFRTIMGECNNLG